jgi:hypothetical protein
MAVFVFLLLNPLSGFSGDPDNASETKKTTGLFIPENSLVPYFANSNSKTSSTLSDNLLTGDSEKKGNTPETLSTFEKLNDYYLNEKLIIQ